MSHKPRVKFQLDVPTLDTRGTSGTTTTITPEVRSVKWTRNNHLVADEMTVTISWKDSGVDPRQLRNGRGSMYMWDASVETFDPIKHHRFSGICKKARRSMGDGRMDVELSFHDYTTLFINMKPFPTRGMPEYSDTLEEIWRKICDFTGAVDPNSPDPKAPNILSSVAALRDKLVVGNGVDPSILKTTLGSLVNERFLKIAKPTPPARTDAWHVWQWCINSLGLMSYIDGDRCIVTVASKYYHPEDSSLFIWGNNIAEFEESVDTDITVKGVMMQSHDPLTGRVLEAVWPPVGDERIKTPRAAVKREAKGKGELGVNDSSAEWEPFEAHGVTDPAALLRLAQQTYEERSRQEVEGTIKTHEMTAKTPDGIEIDLLDLRAGSAIQVLIRPNDKDAIVNMDDATAFQYLLDKGYDDGVAELIVRNSRNLKYQVPIFHVSSIDVDLSTEQFMLEIKYHNIILTQ